MQLINIQQNTPEWHHYRQSRIGATDFNSFCKHKGLYVPYYKNTDTLEQHFYDKLNPEEANKRFEENHFVQIGKQLEPQLLSGYNELVNGCYTPTIIEHEKGSIFSSLDGYDVFREGILEIKTTAKNPQDEKDLIECYLYQCIHQMFCSEVDQMVLLINYYKYDVTKHYVVRSGGLHYKTKVYFLDQLIHEVYLNSITHLQLCNEYLELLERYTDEKNHRMD